LNTEKFTAKANTGEYGRHYAEILLLPSITDNQPTGNGTENGRKKLVADK